MIVGDHSRSGVKPGFHMIVGDHSRSLGSLVNLSLQNYSTVTMVKTSIYDVNTKCAADTYMKFLL